MILLDNITGDTYKRVIQYAVQTSDAMLVSTVNEAPRHETVEEYKARVLSLIPGFVITDEIEKRWRQEEEEYQADRKLFDERCLPFWESLSPFLIKKRHNAVWPTRTMVMSPSAYTVGVYRVCEEVYPLLLKPESYCAWRYPLYPEDLCFIDRHRCWLCGCSHENTVAFYPRSQEEYAFFQSLGIQPAKPYEPILEEDFFWEEY